MNIELAKVEAYDILVSEIYRSIDADQPWVKPLEMLRQQLDANVACIRISQKRNAPRQHLFASGPQVCPSAIEEWERVNARELLPIELSLGEAKAVDWRGTIGSGTYGALLERYDVAYMAAMCIDVIDGAQCTLNISRGFDREDFSSLEMGLVKAVGDHFRQAMHIRREMTRAKIVSQFQTDALDSLGVGAILVSKAGGYFLLNQTARFAIEHQIGLKVKNNGIHTIDEHEDSAFQAAIRSAFNAVDGGPSRAMRINRGDDERIHVIVRPRAHVSLMSDKPETSALVFVRISEIVSDDDIKMLQQLFTFTATEAHLAVGLAKGLCLKDIETQLNIRHNTARAHLRSMFVKADVSRQSQLVSLLTSSLVPLGRQAHPSLH